MNHLRMRVWNKNLKCWVKSYVHLILINGYLCRLNMSGSNKEEEEYEITHCTDVPDRNGDLIYEGDFCRYHGYTYFVEYENGSFMLGNIPLGDIPKAEIEITGNRFER